MTNEEAIKQLDWYFNFDDGGAAEVKTREAYFTLKRAAKQDESYGEKRYITLLCAAHTLLKRQHDSNYVLNLLAETVFYDDAECDGNCLLDDIEYYFDEIGVEMPEKERVNP